MLSKEIIIRNAWRARLIVTKYAPEILLVSGISGVVTSTILACKATLKSQEIVDEVKDLKSFVVTLKEENSSTYTDQSYKKDLYAIQIQAAYKLFKLYMPSIGLGTLSIFALISGHKILTSRNVALLGAYKLIDEGFNKYRERVIDKYGPEDDNYFRFGVEKKEEPKKIKGTKSKKEENSMIVPPCELIGEESIYSRYFNKKSLQWKRDDNYNLAFLKGQQIFANHQLQTKGHIFLNEVYDSLGIPRSKEGAIVGWVLNGNGDNVVDFGIFNPINNVDMTKGYREWWLLDFNVDGVIWDFI